MSEITILPFDLKGNLSSNYFSGEEHTLTLVNGKTNRMFCPEFGAYYADSLVVRTVSGTPLVRGVDYDTTYYYKDIWDLNAKSACAIIVITNPDVPNTVRISYQALGGPYAISVTELATILDEIENNPTKVPWENILGKPLEWWPAPHEHEYWQLYGMESTVTNLKLLGKTWATGRKGILNDNRYFYRNYIALAQAAVDDYTTAVLAHINNRSNPHLSDKEKIGLGNLSNWPMANATQAISTTVNNRYQSVGGVFEQLVNNVTPLFNAHASDRNNPHQVSLDHPLLNLYSESEIRAKFNLRLARTDTATDSKKFAGLEAVQVYNQIRAGLDASSVSTTTNFVQSQFAPIPTGFVPNDYTLLGNQTFERYSNLMQAANNAAGNIHFIGGLPLANYLHLPVGTYVITAYQQTLLSVVLMRILAYRRDASGFVQII